MMFANSFSKKNQLVILCCHGHFITLHTCYNLLEEATFIVFQVWHQEYFAFWLDVFILLPAVFIIFVIVAFKSTPLHN